VPQVDPILHLSKEIGERIHHRQSPYFILHRHEPFAPVPHVHRSIPPRKFCEPEIAHLGIFHFRLHQMKAPLFVSDHAIEIEQG
jgi:hypothetical protein